MRSEAGDSAHSELTCVGILEPISAFTTSPFLDSFRVSGRFVWVNK